MPLPSPNENEKEDEFIARCMGNPTVKDDFKDQKQRLAICYSQWRRKHPQAEQGGQYQFYASMHSPHEKDGKRYALLRVITTKASGPSIPSGKRWRPSYESLRKCLGTILRAPLIGPPCRPGQGGACGHLAHREMGHPVDWTMPNGYADVIYEITDDEAWRNLQSGAWHDVSPQITWSKRHFEGDIGVADDWFFDHVAFVHKGAFQNVEVLDWWQGDSTQFYRLAAELLHSQSQEMIGLTESLVRERMGLPTGCDLCTKKDKENCQTRREFEQRRLELNQIEEGIKDLHQTITQLEWRNDPSLAEDAVRKQMGLRPLKDQEEQ